MVIFRNIWGKRIVEKGQEILETEPVITLTDADTWYKITGTFSYGTCGTCIHNFTLNPSGILTYNGGGGIFHFSGTSEMKVDKVGSLTYGLFKNGVLVPNIETHHDFVALAKTQTMAITGILKVETGDVFEIYTKTDVAGTVLTVGRLMANFWGE